MQSDLTLIDQSQPAALKFTCGRCGLTITAATWPDAEMHFVGTKAMAKCVGFILPEPTPAPAKAKRTRKEPVAP